MVLDVSCHPLRIRFPILLSPFLQAFVFPTVTMGWVVFGALQRAISFSGLKKNLLTYSLLHYLPRMPSQYDRNGRNTAVFHFNSKEENSLHKVKMLKVT